ncbi:MAG TPA: FkbM family methyltransferase [Bryobacteraceae bacterium]|nr:FkbM family methyltransferase [Bryobacteraceae bacterium]
MFHFTLRYRKPQIIFQVGAYLGDDTLIEASRKYGHHLYMFEPNPKRVADLMQKAAGAPTIRVIPAAVSNYDGRATFHIACHDDCSSLQNFASDANQTWVHEWHPYKRFEMVDELDVEVVRLDTFLNREGIDHIDLLEIDAQGEDLRVVASLGERIHEVKRIQIEVNIHAAPLYDNSFGMNDAVRYFGGRGFEKYVSWKQCLNREENVIFRNRRYFPHVLVNRLCGFVEERIKAAYFAALKVPRVLQVTRMMLRQKLSPQRP